ncbi:centrosomal protein kizuna isoform X2 [Pleuronectes platessa]|uniref:centrosomal protein kizuna isoform X2 n=1 Tax=Pleuronectes platessa TaxID=8262 RepID=UPI00232A57FE|nr:centrosomal protein kizuna isoform X2 [Pleuronectes platessa]
MSSPSRREDRYYEKITSIQQSMHQREKRRLELERELFVYSRSDKRILQIKCSKLRSYLKEISNREARAKMRNLELLSDVECIEISMKEYSPDHGPLEQQKADFFKKISKCMEEKKKMEKGLEAAKIKAVQRQHVDDSLSHQAKNSTTVIFTDQQTSRASDAGTTSVHSPQAMRRSPDRSVHSRERLPSGLLKDIRVGEEEATSNRTRLSDKISGSNDSPDRCNLSDKHERKMAVLPSVCTLTGASGNVPFGSDDEQEPLRRVNLTGPQRNQSPGSRVPTTAKDSPAEGTKSLKMAHQPPIMEAGGKSLSLLMPEHTSGKGAQDSPDSKISQVIRVSTPGSDVELSESSASDLSVSLTQSELSEDVESERNATSGGSDALNQHSLESPIHSDGSKKTAVTLESLCNVGAGLNDEDLGACGAVVLHELQRLSWSTAKGCLLSQELVSSHQSSSDPNEISASLPPDAARLWDRWFKHALLLKERRVLNTERLVQLFTPLLLERHASYSHQAKVLLRTLLSRSSEECPSAEDESDLSSSCDSPSLLVDSHVKPTRSAQQQQIQELQSAEEDSQDESPVESVPIRETKAYQLLKQSAMQERQQSSEEEEEEEEEEVDGLSGINHVHEEDLGRAKRSSHQDPYPGTEKTNSKARTALQSKALWGESDDSYSEIEAALRPQPFNTNNDDIDDFYD